MKRIAGLTEGEMSAILHDHHILICTISLSVSDQSSLLQMYNSECESPQFFHFVFFSFLFFAIIYSTLRVLLSRLEPLNSKYSLCHCHTETWQFSRKAAKNLKVPSSHLSFSPTTSALLTIQSNNTQSTLDRSTHACIPSPIQEQAR